MIIPAYFPETDYVVATRGDGYAFVYFPTGWPAEIQLDKIGAKTINAYWFDPRNGESKFIETIPGYRYPQIYTSIRWRGNDWILVLDDASKNFKAPGKLSRSNTREKSNRSYPVRRDQGK